MKTKHLVIIYFAFVQLLTPSAFAQSTFAICSKLDFSNISWSNSLKVEHREPFALALNISGSFEGPEGWSNLASNFDGMGFSLGLLNQNLGMGTLQPLFIVMRNRHFSYMKKMFTPDKLAAVLNMLSVWEKTPPPPSFQTNEWLRDQGFSELDEPALVAQELNISENDLLMQTQESSPEVPPEVPAPMNRNQTSVEWAKTTVLDGKAVKVDWATELKTTSASAPYRSIQVAEAEYLHAKALELFNLFRMSQLRSYLFFFDIVVQNGGIPEAVVTKYFNWLKANPKASGTAKLTKILEYRLPYVRKRFRADVRARKMSLIHGRGRVHGHDRNYSQEYCANTNAMMPR